MLINVQKAIIFFLYFFVGLRQRSNNALAGERVIVAVAKNLAKNDFKCEPALV